MPLSETEALVVERLRSMEPQLVAWLERLVGISSHTQDFEGVNEVGRAIEQELMKSGMRVGAFVTGRSGQHMVARSGCFEGNRLMLLGHLDTVYPKADAEEALVADPASPLRMLGPGATDMKGGLVVMLAAIRALSEEGLLADRALTVVLSADEETGSPTARDIIGQEAEEHHLCLVFESGTELEGTKSAFVTRRRGMLRSTLKIEGLEAHSGVDKGKGVSAALEAAHRIIALESLNDESRGISVNVGLVQAGTAANTVPGSAVLEIDARFDNKDDFDELREMIESASSSPGLPQGREQIQAKLEWIEGVSHQPMPRTEAVERMAKRIIAWGQDLGLELEEESRGGCSDGNVAADRGCPTVDGLGTVGGRIHSGEEWVLKSSLVERAALCAITMLRFYEL